MKTGSLSTNNNNPWAKLPRDLQIQLLEKLRLTLKELARLRLVCKFFHSLLSSDPRFATLYHPPQTKFFLQSVVLNQCPSATSPVKSVYFIHDETGGTSTWTPSVCCPRLLLLMASNDGFLCFMGHRKPNILTICVCNPTAPDLWKILTVPQGRPVDLYECLIGIAFNRKLGACKIVVTGPTDEEMTRTLIYDANADTWRKIPDLDEVFEPRMKEPFVLDGHFYWLVRSRRQQSEMVVVFDVEGERWEQPLVLDDRFFETLCIAELENRLCLISLNKENSQKLELWKLDIQGKCNHTWVKTITAPFHLVSPYSVCVFGGDVMCIGRNGRFWVYHIKDKVWSYVGIFHEDIWKCRDDAMHICTFYKPSLLRFQGDQLLNGTGEE